MTVVAERHRKPVDQHRTVTALGCDCSQGFYFARPVPAGHVETLLHTAAGGGVRLP